MITLVPIVDPRLDFDVWSCRTGKGLHKALIRTQQLTAKYSDTWVYRADVEKFFDNIDHTKLKDCLMRYVDNRVTLNLLNQIIDSYTNNRQTDRSSNWQFD